MWKGDRMRRRIVMVMIMLAFMAGISATAVLEDQSVQNGTEDAEAPDPTAEGDSDAVEEIAAGPGYEVYEETYTLETGCSFPCIQVCGMKDKELEDKVNNSLTQYFSILIEPWFLEERIRTFEPIIHMQTDRYLSVEYVFYYTPGMGRNWYLCVTVDMQTGEVVFLDDLIDINEEFAELIKTGGIVKCDEVKGFLTAEEATEQTKRLYAKYKIETFLIIFRRFTHERLYGEHLQRADRSEEWRIDMWRTLYYHFYYLEEGCIRYSDNAEGLFRPRIMVEDIGEYLKVEPW